MNIGIIQFRWPPLMPYTTAFAEAFARKGHNVHFFALLPPESNDFAVMSKHENLRVYRWYPAIYRPLLFLFKAARKVVRLLLRDKEWGMALEQRLFYRLAIARVKSWLPKVCPRLDVCIGIEKGGLLCAAHLYETRGIP